MNRKKHTKCAFQHFSKNLLIVFSHFFVVYWRFVVDTFLLLFLFDRKRDFNNENRQTFINVCPNFFSSSFVSDISAKKIDLNIFLEFQQ